MREKIPTTEELEDFYANPAYDYILGVLKELLSTAERDLTDAETERDVFRAQGRLAAYKRAILELTGMKGVRLARDARTKKHDS